MVAFSQQRRRGPGQGGITLLELMVVLAIIGFTLTLVAPMFRSETGRAELRQAARTLVSDLREARITAISNAGDAVLLVDTDARGYRLDGPGETTSLPDDVEIEVLTAESEVRDDGVAGIRFFPDGTSTGAAITLKGPKGSIDVTVDWLTGKIAIKAD